MTHYSTTLTFSGRSLKRNQNAVRFKESAVKGGFGPISNALVVGSLLAVLGLIYLTQVTKTSSYGYEVSRLNQRKEALLEENAALKVEAARLQALERVKSSDVAKRLTNPIKTDFATP